MDARRRTISGSIQNKNNSGGGSTTSGSYTVVLNDQWRLSTSISNPDISIYEGVYESNSNYNVNSTAAVMYIDINGLSEFKLYIRSYAESNYDYVMVSQLDKTITNDSSYSDTTLVKAHTRGNQQSGTSISNYTLVEFTGIDKGSHRITIVYRKDGSQHSNQDRGYVLIPKGQGSSDSEGDIIVDPNNYMTIYALEDGLQAKLNGNTVSYSIDEGATWTSLSSDTYTPTVNSGQTIMFKGNLTPTSSRGIGTFTINKQCNLIGNCMSLLFGDNATSNNSLSGKSYAFYNLFKGCTTIVGVSSTFLPATTLASYCYQSMFERCSGLTAAPELPATTLTAGCYRYMFYDCTSLTNAPELPATTLAISCYYDMFCGCSSLVTAPELPATTLANYCYYDMFRECSKLKYIKMLATDISATSCLSSWVDGVSSTGTFVKHSNMTSLPTGTSGIPSGWTVYNNGEEPEQESPQGTCNVGDIAYWNGSGIQTIEKEGWSISLGIPIGVVVIPSNFLPDGKARIISLKYVDVNGNATTSRSSMCWEQSGNYVDTTLTNYTKVPITNNTGSVSSSSNSYGYLPSDDFTGDTSFVDSSAKYSTTNTNKIPSPYNGNEFNTDYSKDISGNNALSDFNGLSNTQTLVGLGSDYEAANVVYSYSDGVSNTQWYLPSAGELGFLVARDTAIHNTISMLNCVSVWSAGYWSSTESSSGFAYYVSSSGGVVRGAPKEDHFSVRPFAMLENNSSGGGDGFSLITFTISGMEYQAVEGMTWKEWCDSSMNTAGYFYTYDTIYKASGFAITGVITSDEILQQAYMTDFSGAGYD